jgi:hypothetical protein
VTAIVWYLKWPFIVFGTIAAFFIGLSWLGHRFLRTMFVILAIVRVMMGQG